MSNEFHKTRIEIIRNNVVISTLIPVIQEGMDDFEMSTSSSVNSFPTLYIKSSNSDITTPFMDFSNKDFVRLSVSSLPNNEYITMFEGEFRKQLTKCEGNPEKRELEINAIHSFYRLSIMELSSSKEFLGITFGEFVTNLVSMANIRSKVIIDNELTNIKIMGLSNCTNALRLFKEVCLIIKATVTFNTDNTVDIGFRAKRREEISSSQATKIFAKDIIKMESEVSIN